LCIANLASNITWFNGFGYSTDGKKECLNQAFIGFTAKTYIPNTKGEYGLLWYKKAKSSIMPNSAGTTTSTSEAATNYNYAHSYSNFTADADKAPNGTGRGYYYCTRKDNISDAIWNKHSCTKGPDVGNTTKQLTAIPNFLNTYYPVEHARSYPSGDWNTDPNNPGNPDKLGADGYGDGFWGDGAGMSYTYANDASPTPKGQEYLGNFPIICGRYKTTSRNTGLEAVSGMCSSARTLTTAKDNKDDNGVDYVAKGIINGITTDKGMDSYDFYTAWGIDTSLGNGADKWWWDSPCFDDEDKAHGACVTDDNGR
jgi:hypothetical protein